MVALIVGLTVVVLLLAVLVAGLLRGHAEILRALHSLGVELDPSGGRSASGARAVPVAAPGVRPAVPGAPGVRPTPARPADSDVIDLTGVAPDGAALSLAVAGVAHDTLVAFLTSGCSTCRGFWDAFRAAPPDVPGGARLVVVTRGPEAESPGAIANLAGGTPVVMSTEVWEHYDIPYAPYFVYVSGPAAKVVGEGVAAGWAEVEQLVSNAVADGTTSPRAAPQRGWHRRSVADQRRDDAVDRQLREAGIEPGDPRLHHAPLTESTNGSRA